jgi:hypothetical protein
MRRGKVARTSYWAPEAVMRLRMRETCVVRQELAVTAILPTATSISARWRVETSSRTRPRVR